MFQQQVNVNPSPGVEGGIASSNPRSTVLGNFVADAAGVIVASFAWLSNGLVNSFSRTGLVPTGFVGGPQDALITAWKGESSMLIPKGNRVTLFDRGDFFVRSSFGDAAVGDKVFANLFDGSVNAAPAGSFNTDPGGTSGVITASFATNVMTPTAGSAYLTPGMKVSGTGVPANTFIEAQLTGTPGACTSATYSLSTYPGTLSSNAAITVTANGPQGGFTGTASFATNVMTVTAVTAGSLAVGSVISSASVAAGTYITGLGTGTGGVGTYNLSTSPGTLSAQAVSATAWVETPFSVKTPGNVGDLIVIGIKN
jgi:hypothetical protein